uniref:Putative portal protein n=1 Tax=viral metagenome TaxID=1070528 RepID=A0A6M3XZP3_9ZZZZ
MTIPGRGGFRTKGDALAGGAAVDLGGATLDRVNFPTPSAWRPDKELADQLQMLTCGSTVAGGTEQVVDHAGLDKIYGLYRLSPLLQPIIQALQDNVYAVGFSVVPRIDPDAEDAPKKVKEALSFEKVGEDFDADPEITDEEVEKEIARLRARIRNEKLYLERFFENCCSGVMSITRLCILVGQDMEVADSGYMEVIRNGITGKPERLDWAPGWSIRAKPIGEEYVVTPARKRLSPVRAEDGVDYRQFRSWVQIDWNGQVVGRYKDFGDPRCMSRKTGKHYRDLEEMHQNEIEWDTWENPDTGEQKLVGALPATELLQFSLPNAASSTYGLHQWSGGYPGVEGTRDLDEENQLVVTDQKIPQMMMFISGGRGIPKEDIERFKAEITQSEPGQRGIYIIQAAAQQYAGSGPSSDPKFHIERTKSEQHTDALGLLYKKDSYDQVRRMWRIPKVALGDEEGLNKATGDLMFRYAETNVYDPKRDIFVGPFNAALLPELGIECVQLRMQSRVPRDPEILAKIITGLVSAGVLTPDEGREFAGDIFNKDMRSLEGKWTKLPTPLLTAILQTKNQFVAAALLSNKENLLGQLESALLGDAAKAADAQKLGGNVQEEEENGPEDGPEPAAEEAGKKGSKPVKDREGVAPESDGEPEAG